MEDWTFYAALERELLADAMRQMLKLSKIGDNQFEGTNKSEILLHSVRIGGVRSATDSQLPDDVIKRLADWSSDKMLYHYMGDAKLCPDQIAIPRWPLRRPTIVETEEDLHKLNALDFVQDVPQSSEAKRVKL